MKCTVEPPISAWRVEPRAGVRRGELFEAVNRCAVTLSTGRLEPTAALIATGHQAWLWHPGILAKDMVMTRAAPRFGAGTVHVVVDQDILEELKLELPVRRGDRLEVEMIHLAPHRPAVPTGWQPPVDVSAVIHNIHDVRDRLGAALQTDPTPLIEAFTNLPDCRSLAEQITVVLARLMAPLVGSLPVLFVSDLAHFDVFGEMVDRMLNDARRCVEAYNAATAQFPGAGVAPLMIEQDRVELPLWLARWEQPRQRVFVDLSDTRPILTFDSGEPIPRNDPERDAIVPRALSLTAALRRWCCDLFIHGKGGGVYDRITDEWWRRWAGEELATLAVVSADLRLELGVPVAEPGDLQRTRWSAHHVASNIDRVLKLDSLPEVARKRELLAHMHDDRDRRRRFAAFKEIHHINAELAQAFPLVLAQAHEQLARARAGLANRAVASKRDWCFALYPPNQLAALADHFG